MVLFVNTAEKKPVQLPILFWKVVIFQKDDNQLYRVGFMMSQNSLLIEHGMIEELESAYSDDDLFMQFKDASTYQVNISLIEEISGMKMPNAIDSYADTRNIKLVLEEIDIDPELESDSIEYQLGFVIENIKL